jgi:hypothetical protein
MVGLFHSFHSLIQVLESLIHSFHSLIQVLESLVYLPAHLLHSLVRSIDGQENPVNLFLDFFMQLIHI